MEKSCNDKNCPIHGNISVRGKVIQGIVVKKKALKSAQIEMIRTKFIPKYERYVKEKHKIIVHCPECMNISVGDNVECGETRKISKTKYFVITKKLSKVDMKVEGIDESLSSKKNKKEKVKEEKE